MSLFQKIILIITIIGAINWGLVGIFDFNLVGFLFGNMTFLTRTIYIIVGLAGITNIALLTLRNEPMFYREPVRYKD